MEQEAVSWENWPLRKWENIGFNCKPIDENEAKKFALSNIRNLSMAEFMVILDRPESEYCGHGSELYNLINNPETRRNAILHAYFGKKIPDMKIHRYKPVWVCQDCGYIKHGILLCSGTKMLFTECSECLQTKPCMDIGR
jgi:hypothetical protein